jgi:predicted MPP superfamily phosphohydrolase
MIKNKNKCLALILCIIFIAILLIFVIGFFLSQNLVISEYNLTKNTVISDIKIMQISDLHYPINEVTLDTVSQAVKNNNPHLIALTGDILDGGATTSNMSEIVDFFDKIASSYPTYFVLGNHEIGNVQLVYLMDLLDKSKIILLNNEINILTVGENNIAIIGLSDGRLLNEKNVDNLQTITDCNYSLLLAHRPELFENYASNNIDLALTGHAHGGQVRIFNQGLVAPNQGFFPEYSHGLYTINSSNMIVNSGLTNKWRVFNPYEIGIITISAD